MQTHASDLGLNLETTAPYARANGYTRRQLPTQQRSTPVLSFAVRPA
jgi:hypothetical protein